MISGTKSVPPNPSRKLRAFGKVTIANSTPSPNSKTEDTMNGIEYFFSFAVSPGTMNAHSW